MISRLQSGFRRGERRGSAGGSASRQVSRLAWFLVLPLVCLDVSCDRNTEDIRRASAPDPAPAPPSLLAENAAAAPSEAVARLLEEREHLDKTIWAKEVEAQQYEEAIVRLWDNLRAGDDTYTIAEQIRFDLLKFGTPTEDVLHENEIVETQYAAPGEPLDPSQWRGLLSRYKRQGFELVQSEWHHAEFDVDEQGNARSKINMVLHVVNAPRQERLQINGRLDVQWTKEQDEWGHFLPGVIDASDVTIYRRQGPAAFKEIYTLDTRTYPLSELPSDDMTSVRNLSPVLVYDLDRDGLSDIVLSGRNIVLMNEGGGRFAAGELCAHPVPSPMASILADFTGDGRPDYLCLGRLIKYPQLFIADPEGRFSAPPVEISRSAYPTVFAICATAGDIDGDGDLDVWVAQHTAAYLRGQMPTPFYDANDGLPSYLLRNEGDGTFVEATAESGLDTKRFRRTYASSFVDLDEDGDLDLLVSSDYAGVDVHYNDGTGHFSDVTATAVDEGANFAMSHAFADYNLDGKLDFYVTGMASTTARRLEQMGLHNMDHPEYREMRMRMGYGNRMYLAGEPGVYAQPAFNNQVNRSGWSWGSSAFDFDNDGDADIYVGNGHISGKSSKDYCTRYWCHDIYTGTSKPNPELQSLFGSILGPSLYSSDGISWNGYEKNALFMNESGRQFVNVAFLMGCAFEYDTRSVVTDDLDLDGRPDLLAIEAVREWSPVSRTHQILHVYRNEAESRGNWIGIKLQDEPGLSPIGAAIRVQVAGRLHIARVLNGDSYQAQHSTTKHFGIGPVQAVDFVEVQWPNGQKSRIEHPAINTYHAISIWRSDG